MSEEKVPYKVELINLAEIAKLRPSYLMHGMQVPTIKAAKLGGPKAIEILKNKPGGADVIAKLNKRGKLKDLKSAALGTTIGYSEPTSGDAWSAWNAEIWGPPVSHVLFCCIDGPNGSWQSNFNMPAQDDLLAMVHVSGNGTVSAKMDGVLLGAYPFSGDDWIVVLVSDLVAGAHIFKITQTGGYFYWLSTEYIKL